MLDTTLGTLITFVLLRLTERVFGYDSGDYGHESEARIDWEHAPDYRKWGRQILGWVAICFSMKGALASLMFAGRPVWERVGTFATNWCADDPQLQLVFVMICTPTVMNIFQFLVTDQFIKSKPASPNARLRAELLHH